MVHMKHNVPSFKITQRTHYLSCAQVFIPFAIIPMYVRKTPDMCYFTSNVAILKVIISLNIFTTISALACVIMILILKLINSVDEEEKTLHFFVVDGIYNQNVIAVYYYMKRSMYHFTKFMGNMATKLV